MLASQGVEVTPAQEVYLQIQVKIGEKVEIGSVAGTHCSARDLCLQWPSRMGDNQ